MSKEGTLTLSEQQLVHELRTQRSFLGHPKAVGTLSFMQLCNSFANYTMSAILIYYLYATKVEGGLGLSQTDAAQLISLYSALSLLAGLVGSYVADRILGPRAGLRLSRCAQAVAYVVLAVPGMGIPGYAASQILLIFGVMLSGRSLESVMGKMYESGDERKDGAFTITYTIANIGAAVPAIAGAISLVAGYHAAFAVGAVVAVLGAGSYLLTERRFFGPIGDKPDDPLPAAVKRRIMVGIVVALVAAVAILALLFMGGSLSIKQFANTMSTAAIFIPIIYLIYIVNSRKTTRGEARRVLALLPLYACNCLSMLVWTQSTSILAIYAETSVDLNLLGFKISPATFQTIPAVLGLVFGSLAALVWARLGDRQPTNPWKVGAGTVLWGLGPVFMCLPFILFPAGVRVSPIWLVAFYVLIIAGEALNSPTGYAAACTVAPAAFATQMVTVWSLSQSTGAGLSTLASQFYIAGGEVPYFLIMGGLTIAMGLIVVAGSRALNRRMGGEADSKGRIE
ncbi:amino acid/peptide transporter [Coriobacterium glomerans PW2]|uniref:Amino acid/peptide transporter n=1 Tax=Coriobacterium glomerans (strain ATCC 49209 / DSM 20642 / JCM 10262 / PW2) TaxID=700015 RepID=F2N9X0_CORGP|nr:oligopeptide:H+ symporter [Coriobacterium glomerans]AEB06225.1 amino acid/peptide transporter [Coriobacterium glomerans PW2]